MWIKWAIVCALAIALYLLGRWAAVRFAPRWLPLMLAGGLVLAIPGVLFASYYLHCFDDWVGFISFRAYPGTEFLGAGAGFLAGVIDRLIRKHTRASGWAIPTLAFLGVTLPFLKPLLAPLDHSTLVDRWEGEICLQSTASTCGPASAATIVQFLGGRSTESELALAAHTSSSGTEIWYLIRALRPLGYEGTARCAVARLDEVHLPAIAGVRNKNTGAGHFVAIIQHKDNRWLIGDPLAGGAWFLLEEATQTFGFTGFFLEVGRRAE